MAPAYPLSSHGRSAELQRLIDEAVAAEENEGLTAKAMSISSTVGGLVPPQESSAPPGGPVPVFAGVPGPSRQQTATRIDTASRPGWGYTVGLHLLPLPDRARYAAEWRAELTHVRGRYRRLRFSADLIRGAIGVRRVAAAVASAPSNPPHRLSHQLARRKRTLQTLLILCSMPVIGMNALLLLHLQDSPLWIAFFAVASAVLVWPVAMVQRRTALRRAVRRRRMVGDRG